MKSTKKSVVVLGQNICKKGEIMERNEFDDIILEKTDKNERIKKILLRIIALIILFLIVMIVMKLINSDDTKRSDVLPTEPLSLESQNSDNNGFENVPITQNDSPEDQFEALKRQIEGETNTTASSATEDNVPVQDIANFTTPSEEALSNPTPLEPAPTPKAQVSTPPPVKVQKPQQTKTPKKQEKSEVKETPKNNEAKPVSKEGLTPGLYVQIFSVNNLDQKSKELATVKQKGYDYKLHKVSANGKEITKVLIGPFDKNNISAELDKIRKNITKDAFSVTIK